MNRILIICVLGLWVQGKTECQTYNYAPNAVHLPILTQSGDGTLGIGWGRGNAFQSLELQGAYSPMQHLAVMANYFGAREKEVRKRTEVGTDYTLWELAVGIYEKTSRGSASLFAGYGNGNLFSYYGSENTASFNLRRLFLQPGLSYRSNHFQAGVALRLTHLNYNKGVVSYTLEQSDLQAIRKIEEKSPMFLPELGMNAGLHLKPVTIGMSINGIFPDTDNWDFVRLNAVLSIMVDFNLKRKAKNQG